MGKLSPTQLRYNVKTKSDQGGPASSAKCAAAAAENGSGMRWLRLQLMVAVAGRAMDLAVDAGRHQRKYELREMAREREGQRA